MISIISFLIWMLTPFPPDYCQIYGSMYEVEYASQADYIVYEELSEGSADIMVFEQGNRLYADKPGMWFFENKKDFAKYKVFFTDKENGAHFSVYFTRFESFAGCPQ
ncbi:MAG: hypothetical protein JXQ90_13265 [Cyclobacteriaceae bacterium]